jgi:hypothetical protein
VLDLYPVDIQPKEVPESAAGEAQGDVVEKTLVQPNAQAADTATEQSAAPKSKSRPVINGTPNHILDTTSPITRVLKQVPTLERFEFCQGGGCAEVDSVGVLEDEWKRVREVLTPAAASAEGEREKIKQAIGLMERIIGPKTGTDSDRGGTFGNAHYPGQLDCNDEATNTTTYLKLMLKDGLLHFHHPVDTKTRGFFLNGWPHTTAVIQENEGDKKFAVDSWFYDNGVPPVIIPLEQWRSGWKPDNW